MTTPGHYPSRPLRIGIDARAAAEVQAGRGRFVRELLKALAQRDDPHTYLCYARRPWPQPLTDRFAWRLIDSPDPLWHLRAALAASRDCDVFLSSNSYLTAPFLRIPCVAVVHDLLAFERGMGVPLKSVVVERATLPIAMRCVDRFVCVSHATAAALEARFPAARGRTTVALLAASLPLGPPTRAEVHDLPDPGFVLSVGTLEPRKNLPRLATAYATLSADLQRAHPLVIVGPLGWSHGETLSALQGLGDRCILLGSVSDAVLGELYRRCAAFCYPSLGEGFGLPVLEAMTAGAPVITSGVTSLPEIGGDAVEYVDPKSVASIASSIQRVLSDRGFASQLASRGRRQASRFSWQNTAEEILAALVSVGTQSARMLR